MKKILLVQCLASMMLLAFLTSCTVVAKYVSGTADNKSNLASGIGDNLAGEEAVIGGGASNQALGFRSVIGGGAENNASNAYATICGGAQNRASGSRATIAGGVLNTASAFDTTIGGGSGNLAEGQGAVVSGGGRNTAGHYAVVAGGLQNQAEHGYASVCGGVNNLASGTGAYIGGGAGNQARGANITLSGGLANMASGDYSAIAGGRNNQADGYAAAIPGGEGNQAGSDYSLAAGLEAIIQVDHPGTFLFADASGVDFTSERANEFAARATGGVRFVTALDEDGAPQSGAYLAPGSGSWSMLSDRQAKADLLPAERGEILAKISQLPVYTWRYRSQPAEIRHIGPSAQDFHAVFGLGEDAGYISAVDADGVALAGLGEAVRLLNEQEKQIGALSARLDSLEKSTPGAHNTNPLIASSSLLIGVLIGWKLHSVIHRRNQTIPRNM